MAAVDSGPDDSSAIKDSGLRLRFARIAGAGVLIVAAAAASTLAICGPQQSTEAIRYLATGFGAAGQPTAASRELYEQIKLLDDGYWYLPTYDCKHASQPAAPQDVGPFPDLECKARCNQMPSCTGFIHGHRMGNPYCWLRKQILLYKCQRMKGWEEGAHDAVYIKQAPFPQVPSHQPVLEFYMYRATGAGMFDPVSLGQVNTANLDGVLFYLTNEIVSNYGSGPRCPRRFNISEIHRIKVKVRTTDEFKQTTGMTFGPRYAYNHGYCDGRCFAKSRCTGSGDCATFYARYGFVVGCNRFSSMYPFPDFKTPAPDGVWYSLPSEGRCQGVPTGTKDCTWSYEDAGVITFEQFESFRPGKGTCCEGRCTHIWDYIHEEWATKKRAEILTAAFAKFYPNMPASLPDPPCDFEHTKIWGPDPWVRFDPNPEVPW